MFCAQLHCEALLGRDKFSAAWRQSGRGWAGNHGRDGFLTHSTLLEVMQYSLNVFIVNVLEEESVI